MKNWIIAGLIGLSSTSLWAQNEDRGSDKLDLKKLEDKYWAAKDTDLAVVQNRTYAKEKRFFASLSYGPMVNDPFSYGRMTNISAGYYFTERWGVELAMETASLKDNDSVVFFRNEFGTNPDYNNFERYTSVNFIIVPFYAKMSFWDRHIMYFDMQFAFGLGNMNYTSKIDETDGGDISASSFGYNIDFTQNLFFSEHLAFRLDIKNKWTKQSFYKNNTAGNTATKLKDSTVQDTTILLGLMTFF